MNNPFDYTPDKECRQAYQELLQKIDVMKKSPDPSDINFCRELDAGKMLGVLIAEDKSGGRHTLYAFSGQIGADGFNREGFVDPVFDYLQPDGYFKRKEAEISNLNREIEEYERGVYASVKAEYDLVRKNADARIMEFKEQCRVSKRMRDELRKTEPLDAGQRAAMLRQSQFEKAELRRLKKRIEDEMSALTSTMEETRHHLDFLKAKRRSESEALQQWLFSGFRLLNAKGESRSLGEVFSETAFRIPPSGAGECCGPKLLQSAYLKGWMPISIAEYWYGASKGGEVRRHGDFYPACRGKCRPVLGWMLEGLSVYPPLDAEPREADFKEPLIVFENEWFCIVEKPSGMLSVPGKGSGISVEEWLSEKYGESRKVKMAHRLDQDTSGLIVAAFGDMSLRVLQTMFFMRGMKKTYVAELDGDFQAKGILRSGRISLPLSPDWLDRPRQRVDFNQGKEAVTDYEFMSVSDGRSRVIFRPLTGRTHQLRIHAASSAGLGMPIAGDRLYGHDGGHTAQRMLLHAHRLEFTFPIDKRHYSFESAIPF